MNFDYNWDLYKNTKEGKFFINFFRNLESNIENKNIPKEVDHHFKMLNLIPPSILLNEENDSDDNDILNDREKEEDGEDLKLLCFILEKKFDLKLDKIYSYDELEEFVKNLPNKENIFTFLDSYFPDILDLQYGCLFYIEKRWKLKIENITDTYQLIKIFYEEEIFHLDEILEMSTILFNLYPNLFFPYFFSRKLNLLKRVCNTFNIYFPKIPPKRKHKERFLYYYDLCCSFQHFKEQHNMQGYEFSAFLYDYALKNLPEKNNVMLKPKMAFFIGGGKKSEGIDYSGDFEALDNVNENTVYNWQGNAYASPGDIVIMYCLSPRSYIHSIWRAIDYGDIDPFFYFYNNTDIGKPIRVTNIHLNEIKNDSILKNMPLVRGNMQGLNGVKIEKQYYDRILELLNNKGFDISKLPELDSLGLEISNLQNEKDIEIKLLEPLLQKIGYTQFDWVKQLIIKMGRNEKIIPDYVLLHKKYKNNDSAYWVWEAKFKIPNSKELERSFQQVVSYGTRLTSKGVGIISQEGVWINKSKNFDFDQTVYYTWKDLKDNIKFDEFYKVSKKP